MKHECPSCHTRFRKKDKKFCPECGARIDSGTAEIVMILDRSGSMGACHEATIAGVNSFIRDQQSLPGTAVVTLAQFDDEYELIHDRINLADVPELNAERYMPRGATALWDAIGRTVNSVSKQVSHAAKVICVIVTDGFENASREFDRSQIMDLIKARESLGWKFVYLGANQDAIGEARKLGIELSANYVATPAGTRNAYASANYCCSTLRSGASLSVDQFRASASP